ncbi:bifunctional hydroxymethylpyrimidine kinase/phosphomethylpyrimidine kinase [Sulfolobus sp. S-194]|uniref:bifunctional hydroxymethylpyrimidine kinase/phosphomethylpyrimidine kinase n=1 Tax=Sulfolobus sp. S-194 TaxID=2512240 RepID=UPI0014373C20|nr:bifunctional hydroxymethylpyrimidine kinase/phosphomethylpyrimidine kinase [Sulfolobus sp. S-194]QIW23389.1 bifunctional hydroxymethylpyrimidine kinase/phosphomethylpyrimidine kinase [Sulfolobus sp. S-194]
MKKVVALSVAGIDTGNGAGAETDTKVYEMLGVHGTLVVTAITAQNTRGIKDILVVKKDFLQKQLETVLEDFNINSVKIGMIYNKEQYEVVKEYLEGKTIVTDPVIFAKDGTQLIKDIEDYKKYILPITIVLTPNAVEASYFSGINIKTIEDMKKSSKIISNIYNIPYVIVKGGHITTKYSFDVLYDAKKDSFFIVGYERINQKNTHGTGSVFSTVISAELAKGEKIYDAVKISRDILQTSIEYGLEIGKGIGPIDPLIYLEKNAYKYKVIENMYKFADFVESTPSFYKLIPEVQSNLAHSIPSSYVKDLNDIATFKNRIIRNWDNKVSVGFPVVFGKPTHTARLLLAIIRKGERATVLINIRYDENIIRLLRLYGYEVIEIEREKEPEYEIEGKSMQWIIDFVYKNYGKIPNVIFDKGMKGKEAMIRIWTEDIATMIDTLNYICKNLS